MRLWILTAALWGFVGPLGALSSGDIPDDRLIPLESGWSFRALSPGLDLADGPFEGPTAFWQGPGLGEYTLSLDLPLGGGPYSLLAENSVYTAAEFWVNGQRAAVQGRASDEPRGARPDNRPIRLDLPRTGRLELRILAANHHHHQGGLLNPILIGTREAVDAYFAQARALDWFLIGLFGTFALYHLALFLIRPRERNTLYFALLTLFLALRLGATGIRVFGELWALDYALLRFLELSGWYAGISLTYLVFRQFFPQDSLPWAGRSLSAGSILLIGTVLFTNPVIGSWTIYPAMILSLIAIALTLGTVLTAWVRRRPQAPLLGSGLLVFAVFVVYDLGLGLELYEGPFLSEFGLAVLLATQGLALLQRFLNAFKEAELLGQQLERTNLALRRFVPVEFLNQLGRPDLESVRLGDRAEKVMTVLFTDLRNFTTVSERLSPGEVMDLLGRYLGTLSRRIEEYGGFIDKFMGDGIMALFPGSPRQALDCGITMQKDMRRLNASRDRRYPALRLGIGIHTGPLVLGTLGTEDRMEPSVISDTVNVASRVEHLCKRYGSWLLMTQEAFFAIDEFTSYTFRILQRTKVKGRREAINVIEIFDPIPGPLRLKYLDTQMEFERGLLALMRGRHGEAAELLTATCRKNPHDRAAARFLALAQRHAAEDEATLEEL